MRYKCVCSYDGHLFCGWQRQPKVRTVQQEIEKTLAQVYRQSITIHGASRTDSGVHAYHQVFHYDVERELPLDKLPQILNHQLPQDIFLVSIEPVDTSFHARYSCTGKTYRYQIETSPQRNVFRSMYDYHYGDHIDLSKIRAVCDSFIGTHDFKGFMASGSDKENTVRTLYEINVEQVGTQVHIRVSGSGFLYNMVRIMVGTLLSVSEGKLTPDQVIQGLADGNRQAFRRTAPANGLYLIETRYK